MGRQEALLGCPQHTRKPCLVSVYVWMDSALEENTRENNYTGSIIPEVLLLLLQVLGVMGTDCRTRARGLGSQANITTQVQLFI